eukprot:IDg4308t1
MEQSAEAARTEGAACPCAAYQPIRRMLVCYACAGRNVFAGPALPDVCACKAYKTGEVGSMSDKQCHPLIEIVCVNTAVLVMYCDEGVSWMDTVQHLPHSPPRADDLTM